MEKRLISVTMGLRWTLRSLDRRPICVNRHGFRWASKMRKSRSVAGLDGCRIGWLCVELGSADDARIDAFPDIDAAWRAWSRTGGVALALIDIPIGLRECGPEPRACETEARRLLGKRRSSVFTPPVRSSLAMATYEAASEHNHRLTGRKLSKQAWGIAAKIRQVDDFLAREPDARTVLRESHPELLFRFLDGGRPMAHPKRTREGFRERLALASKYLSAAPRLVSDARHRYRTREVADDDILDALIAAIAARHCARAGVVRTLPRRPERDARGLPMEMVYALPRAAPRR